MKCDTCKMKRACAELERMGKVQRHENCRCYIQVKPVTNYDRIVSKSPEELAKWLNSHFRCPPKTTCPMGEASCEKCWLDYLKREVED